MGRSDQHAVDAQARRRVSNIPLPRGMRTTTEVIGVGNNKVSVQL